MSVKSLSFFSPTYHSIDEHVSCSYETEIEKIQAMIPKYSERDIAHLKVNRQGNVEDSAMVTLGLHKGVRQNQVYRVTLNGLEESDQVEAVRYLEKERFQNSKKPPAYYAEVEAIWDKTPCDQGGNDNILGHNGSFKVASYTMTIPVIEAEESALSYYGATLVNEGDLVEFDEDQYPIWAMSLGTNYVQGYLMEHKGFYLEYHHDKPHFHMPLSDDAGGCYLLAKKVSTIDSELGKDLYHVTGFRIPFGKAVYTFKGSIHCDAALTGSLWMVGYTNAEDFSTVLVHDPKNEKIPIRFDCKTAS